MNYISLTCASNKSNHNRKLQMGSLARMVWMYFTMWWRNSKSHTRCTTGCCKWRRRMRRRASSIPRLQHTKMSKYVISIFYDYIDIKWWIFISCMSMKIVVNCEWGPWGEWDICTRTCGGGMQGRSREILQPERHGGIACEGDPQEMQGCNMEACPSKICIYQLYS